MVGYFFSNKKEFYGNHCLASALGFSEVMKKKPPRQLPELDLRLQISQIDLIFRQGPLAYVAVFINSLLYTIFSWDEVPQTILLLWLFGLYASTLTRWILQRRWQKVKSRPTLAALKGITRTITLGVVLSGTLWGSIAVFWVFSESEVILAVTTFILAGMTAGAVAAYAAIPRATYGFLTAALLPLVIVLFSVKLFEHEIMAVMALLYWFLMMIVGRNASQVTLNSIMLGLRNEDLTNRMHDASHEIRTPVAAISGFAEILTMSAQCKGEAREHAKIILRNSLYLKRLVENLLQYSQREQLLKTKEWVSVAEEIDSVINLVNNMATEKGIGIEVSYEKDLPDQVLTDGLKFQQILINLLNNAIKFSKHGPIQVQVKEGRPGFISLRVKDLGIGIGTESIQMLFKPFFRENRSEVRRQEGSGLGLALSRKLAQTLGGDIHLLETEVGKGSVFEFEVPTGLFTRISKSSLTGRRIMVVDDSIDIQTLFKNVLQGEGADVTVCTSGSEAVQVIARDFNYDLILMDLNMPVMDGYTATTLIKKTGFIKPIIAFTAYSEKEKCLKFGFEGFINKSESLDRIVALIESHILLPDSGTGRFVS